MSERPDLKIKLDLKTKEDWNMDNAPIIAKEFRQDPQDHRFLATLSDFIENSVNPARITNHFEPLFAKRLRVAVDLTKVNSN